MEQKNVKLFHLFNYQDQWHFINIEEMSAHLINDITAGIVEKLITHPALERESSSQEQLKKLGLLSESKEHAQKTKKEKEFVPVVNMALFLTRSCNLKCIYCYGEGGEYGTGGNMEEKTAYQAVEWLIEQSGKMKKVHIGFFGGEPLLRFSLMKSIVGYAKKRMSEVEKKVDFHITTNGTLLDDEKIAFIKENDISVMISFDGTKELQDSQRPFANGEGSYDSAVPKIRKLLELLPETPGHAVIVGNTDPRIVKNAMKEIGFTKISSIPASISLFAGLRDEKKSVRDTENLIQELEEEYKTWAGLMRNRDSEALKNLRERSVLYQALTFLLHNRRRHYACGAGRGLVAVSSSGDVYLCHRFVGREEYKLGSIFEKELKRDEYQKPVTINKTCAYCFARYYCGGGCKHDNASFCGSISMPSEDMCRLRCRELELSAVLVSMLDSEDRHFLVKEEIFPPKPCPFDF